MAKEFAVIGLGRFGSSLAATLTRLGAEVLAIDVDEEQVRNLASVVTQAVQADATDKNVLQELGIRNFDVAIVAMSAFEASLLVTLYLKEFGARRVVVKAASEVHGKILQQIGADSVIFPEKDMGERLAFSLVSGSVIDHIELADDYTVAEIVIPPALAGKTLRNLDMRNRFGLTVMAIKRSGIVNMSHSPDQALHEGDILVAIGPTHGVQRLNEIFERG